MAKFCTYCGAPLEQDTTVCKVCGVEVASAEKTAPVSQPTPEVTEASVPVQQTPPEPSSEQPVPYGKYAVASTSSFFWFSLLFSLPIIGFICSIIFSFASKNLNTKHYARSVLIWNLVAIIAVLLLVAIFIILSLWLGFTVSDIIYEFGF